MWWANLILHKYWKNHFNLVTQHIERNENKINFKTIKSLRDDDKAIKMINIKNSHNFLSKNLRKAFEKVLLKICY